MSQAYDEAAARPAAAKPTTDIAHWIDGLDDRDITDTAYAWAKHAILDWLGVTIAGTREPLVDMLVDELTDGNEGPCTIVGRDLKSGLLDAALINGAASHALDYDDVNRRLHGHPTVVTAPVALALGEQLRASGRAVLAGFVAGTEVACAVGEMADEGHYEAGFHATATIGTFGAAAAAAKMLGLDASRTAHAMGIAASQAAGLKCNFGTMTKPLHAGKACANGLLAARLAARGFTANQDAIETSRGFADAMAPGFTPGISEPHPPGYFAVQQTLFKYHAACYLTHSTIEAIKELRAAHGIGLDDLDRMTIRVRPSHFSVCNIPEPTTGLEIKFSIRHCAAMALAGIDTGALETYSDTHARETGLNEARERIAVEGLDAIDRMAAKVSVDLKDGRTLVAEHNVGIPADDLERQWEKLAAKFRSLTVPILGEEKTEAIIEQIAALEGADNLDALMATCTPSR